MTEDAEYTVLPVSAIKPQTNLIFESLEAGKTVFIAKHSRIVAAFRPVSAIPDGVMALHGSPYLNVSRVTATHLQKTAPSEEISRAVNGIPSLVEKKGRVFGILTAATAPQPTSPPDLEAISAKSERVRQFQIEHPDASIDEVMAFYDELDDADNDSPTPQDWRLSTVGDVDDLRGDMKRWRDKGSTFEDFTRTVLVILGAAVPAPRAVTVIPPLAEQLRGVISAFVAGGPIGRAAVVEGEQLEARKDKVGARAQYLRALGATMLTDSPDVGAMARLGNLAFGVGNTCESAYWYKLAFVFDALEEQRELKEVAAVSC